MVSWASHLREGQGIANNSPKTSALPALLRRGSGWLRELERRTRPADPEVVAALEQRWHELPTGVRTPGQMLGRKLTGCEGTHGVFPACNFGCKPCYLSANANRVRVDGTHTVAEVDRQMAFLRERRGPAQYAQLIGGEVSLLPAEAHAEALAVMRRYGRMPMSFSHGDFDYEYRSSSGACATRGRRRRRRRRTRTRTDAATYATCPLQLQAS
ncbi:hypothetical protein BH23ACT7_BH23ACT7_08200 [soil metagenome]